MTIETPARIATRDGIDLRYVDSGAGDPPIVFIHGWTCDLTNWRGQLPHLAEHHRVIALDLRGHGESGKPDEDYSIAGFVDDVQWLIGHLGLERPIVVGHSMGGTIGMNLVRRHPDLARALVMVDSPIIPLPEALEPVREQLDAGLRSPAYQAVAAGFARMQFFNSDTPAGLADELISSMSLTPQRVMYSAIADTLASQSVTAGPLPVPVLFIRAATQYATAEQLHQRYPGLEIIDVNSAHFVQLEKPEETNAIIDGFLKGLA